MLKPSVDLEMRVVGGQKAWLIVSLQYGSV